VRFRRRGARAARLLSYVHFRARPNFRPGGTILNRSIRFCAQQVRKSAQNPLRLVLLPRYFFGVFFRQTVYVMAGISPTVRRAVYAKHHFERGKRLQSEERPGEAWEQYRKSLELSDDRLHLYYAAGCAYFGLGDRATALRLWTKIYQSHRARAAALGAGGSQYRVLNYFWAIAVGHEAQIDYIVKLAILEGRKRDDTILYVPPGSLVANRFMLEQWRPHLRFVERPQNLPVTEKAASELRIIYHALWRNEAAGAEYFWEAAAKTYRRWNAERRGVLLKLPADVVTAGWNQLRRIGMPPGAWFVALHVREAGYHRHHAGMHAVRNADISDYMAAIDEIVTRGGWIIRMGDPSMAPLPPMFNVLDYCHSSIRSDWMDIFLSASCRFFVGSASGLGYVAQAYGVPCVWTNWWPPAHRPWQPCDVFVPKTVLDVGKCRRLSLRETLAEPFAYCDHAEWLHESHGVLVEDNDPDDILSAVVEMAERLDGIYRDDPEDIRLRERANQIYESNAAYGSGHISRKFLRKNAALLELSQAARQVAAEENSKPK
jgi:putative glycosyltransferase (TIGR04372 family)